MQRIASSIHPTFQNIQRNPGAATGCLSHLGDLLRQEDLVGHAPCVRDKIDDLCKSPKRVSVIFALHNCGPPNGLVQSKESAEAADDRCTVWEKV